MTSIQNFMTSIITKADFEAQTSVLIVFDGAPQIIADGTDGLLTGSVFLGSTTGQWY